MKNNQIPNGNIPIITQEIIKHTNINDYEELVEEVKSQSGHNTPIEERSDPLPEKRIIASVRFRNANNTQSSKCFKCGNIYQFGKGQNKLLCRNCLWLRNQYHQSAQKWWFKINEREKKQLVEAKNPEQLEKVWQEVNDRRNFWGSGFFLILFTLIYFGWDKFWAWYEKPVKQEWDWDEDDEGEEKLVEVKGEEEPSAEPIPQKGWKWLKNLVLDNKMKTASLVGMVVASLGLVVRVVRLL